MIRKGAESAVDQDQELVALLDEQAAFEEMRSSLRADPRFCDRFVAIHNHAVVDCDADKYELAGRIEKKYPAEVVFIAHVQHDEPPIELPSPEIEP